MTNFPEKFWSQPGTGKIIPVDYMHAVTALRHPDQFGIENKLGRAGLDQYSKLARSGRLDTNRDDDLFDRVYNVLYRDGWIRADWEGSDHLRISAADLGAIRKFLSKLLKTTWVSDLLIDLYQNGTLNSLELESEEIERFAHFGNLPHRYKNLVQKKAPMPTKIQSRIDKLFDPDISIRSSRPISEPIKRETLGEMKTFGIVPKGNYQSGGFDKIFLNPSPQELAGLIQRSSEKALRGILDGTDLYVWDAGKAIHYQVAQEYGLENGIRTEFGMKTPSHLSVGVADTDILGSPGSDWRGYGQDDDSDEDEDVMMRLNKCAGFNRAIRGYQVDFYAMEI